MFMLCCWTGLVASAGRMVTTEWVFTHIHVQLTPRFHSGSSWAHLTTLYVMSLTSLFPWICEEHPPSASLSITMFAQTLRQHVIYSNCNKTTLCVFSGSRLWGRLVRRQVSKQERNWSGKTFLYYYSTVFIFSRILLLLHEVAWLLCGSKTRSTGAFFGAVFSVWTREWVSVTGISSSALSHCQIYKNT